jgi:subtilisin family serine protease
MRLRTRRLLTKAAWVAVAFTLGAPSQLHGQRPQPTDRFYHARGSWGQAYEDQWALKRIGFTPAGSGTSAWDQIQHEALHPVIVAVIDTGLDYFHPDLRRESVWRNQKELPNGRDDDQNGYVDDLIGWNFVDRDNNPWDTAGHGTHIAGIIAAATDNGEGIAGINPSVKIMPLKVMNFIGRGRSSGIAEAIFYAVQHGARVINLSLGGERLSKTEQLAIDYAHQKGAVIVAAAGNIGSDTADYGPAGLTNVITVAATDQEDKRVGFSNWGQAVKIAAPGLDVLSLRARRTDFVLVSGAKDYQPGTAFVGPEARYYRASGTSFSAPFVSGVASLLFAKNPKLTNVQVERMLLMSADDTEVPGWDQYTGAGRLNAVKALKADPDWYLLARVTAVQPVQERGQTVIQVHGTVIGSDLKSYALELGKGEAPGSWKQVGKAQITPIQDGLLGTIPIGEITSRGTWTVRAVARDGKENQREARGTLTVE